MNKFVNGLGLVTAAGLALVASQGFATSCPLAPATGLQTQGSPVCIAPYGQDGSGTGLQNILAPYNANTNPYGIITSGPAVNVYMNQVIPSSFWAIGSTGSSASEVVLTLAGNSPNNTFGIFDPNHPSTTLQLFGGGTFSNPCNGTYCGGSVGYKTFLTNDGNGKYTATYLSSTGVYLGQQTATFSLTNEFGFYLNTGSYAGIFYSNPSLNEKNSTYPNGTPHMVAFNGNGKDTLNIGGVSGLWASNEYIMAWEDTPFSRSDLDYQDFVVSIESVHPVPEPAVLGMFGLGLAGLLFAVWMRRRQYDNR